MDLIATDLNLCLTIQTDTGLTENYKTSKQIRGPMVLYRSPEHCGYAELEQAWKYMTICCISFQQCGIRKQI